MFTAFVSDVHLSPKRPDMVRQFVRFLEGEAKQADSLYILGDLFDHWVGEDTADDPFIAPVLASLRTLSSRGVKLCIMRDNRDFLMQAPFESASGARLIADPCVVDLYGRTTLLMHGDLLCTQDVRY